MFFFQYYVCRSVIEASILFERYIYFIKEISRNIFHVSCTHLQSLMPFILFTVQVISNIFNVILMLFSGQSIVSRAPAACLLVRLKAHLKSSVLGVIILLLSTFFPNRDLPASVAWWFQIRLYLSKGMPWSKGNWATTEDIVLSLSLQLFSIMLDWCYCKYDSSDLSLFWWCITSSVHKTLLHILDFLSSYTSIQINCILFS